jgi:hypothetical protein
MFQRLFAAFCGLALLGFAVSAQATPAQLVTNGDFETGTFLGWTNTGTGSGFGYTINNGAFDPTGNGAPSAPIAGGFDAVSSQTGPGINTLSQTVLLPFQFNSLTLGWLDRIENFANAFGDPNHEFRVSFEDMSGALIGVVFSTNPGDPLIQFGPNNRLFDVTGLLNPFAGQNVLLKFEQQDNLFFFNATLDNISLLAEVPEPLTASLFGFGLLGFGALARRRRKVLQTLS